LILAVVGIARLAGDGEVPDDPVVASMTLVRIDQGTHERMESAVGDGVSGIALGEGSVWLASVRDRSVYDVDPETMKLRNRIPMPEQPLEIAVGAGSVWVTTSTTLFRIDPVIGEIVERISLGACGIEPCRTDVIVADGTVWATQYDSDRFNGRLIRLDPARAGSDRPTPVSARPIALTVGHGAVWILHDDDIDTFLVERIDIGAGTRTLVELPIESSGPLQCLEHDVGPAHAAELCAAITVGRRAVWAATPGDEASWLWRLDPEDGRPTAAGVETACCAMTMVGTADVLETIWVGLSSGEIVQVPEVEGSPSDDVLTVGAPVTDIAIGYGAIWVSVDGPRA